MLDQEATKNWILTAVAEAIAQFAQAGDDISRAREVHVDVYDDQTGASPGRIASFEIDKHGRLTWWNWRTPDACAGADWPLKLRLEFGEGEYRVLWVRQRKWDFDRANRPRVIRMGA